MDVPSFERIARTPSVRPFMAHEWRTYRDLRLRALADSPDAFGGTLVSENARADTEWAERLKSGADDRWNLPLLAEVGAEPIGLAWGRIEKSNPDVANVYQMWVAPTHRRLGAGGLLLETVIAWAKGAEVRRVALSVTCGNNSAGRLYMRAGFRPVGEPEPLRPGSNLLTQPMQLPLAADAA
jgi:GNAT superfamily N-acetyltransferase